MTKQQRTLRRFTQLWLSADDWDPPVPIVEEKGEAMAYTSFVVIDKKILAWIVTRKKPP